MTINNAAEPAVEGAAQSLFVTAPDGLRIYVEDYGPRLAPRLPVVCLPGLARTSADFVGLARALATDAKGPRRVIAMDYRGRGLSDHDRDPGNYTLPTELADLIAVLDARSVRRAVFVGTSRGGLLAMLLGAVQPTRIGGVVLNDIGPVIEPIGLMRIKGYVGKLPQPRSLADGADILKRIFDGQFPRLTHDDWMAFARRTWVEKEGALTLTYDPKLSGALEGIDAERTIPALWPQFDALAHRPMLVLRGALTDLLSLQTVAEMRARRAKLEVLTVPDQGHAPMLDSPELIDAIAEFARGCDKTVGRL